MKYFATVVRWWSALIDINIDFILLWFKYFWICKFNFYFSDSWYVTSVFYNELVINVFLSRSAELLVINYCGELKNYLVRFVCCITIKRLRGNFFKKRSMSPFFNVWKALLLNTRFYSIHDNYGITHGNCLTLGLYHIEVRLPSGG